MSIWPYVIGFVPPDETWQKMKAVWDACKTAGVEVPRDVEEFFYTGETGEPDPNGQEVQIPARFWPDEFNNQGLEVDVSAIPPHVKVVRFAR